MQIGKVDTITFQVLSNKLEATVSEQSIAMKRVSGSVVVTEANDFNNGIYLPDGAAVMVGQQIVVHAQAIPIMIRSTLEDCAENPGINKGDMFFVNDPWKGAAHQSDGGVVAPLFYEDKLVAWSGAVVHQLDIGGMEPGSWCPTATDKFQEGMAIPPIKLVEGGVVRRDIWNMLLAHSRLPFLLGLDLKAQIAGNNISNKRLTELIERYGVDTVVGVMERLIEETEQALRKRLRTLPDGVYRGVDFLDHDGHQNKLYKIQVAVTKEVDTLTFDFTGSSPQAPGFVNCTMAGLLGGIASALFPLLGYDMVRNEGLFRPVKVIAPEGIICNARPPSPVSSASVAATGIVRNACSAALARMLACNERELRESKAISMGHATILNLGGVNQYGEPFGTMLLEHMMGGEGAFSFRDGWSAVGGTTSVQPSVANIEMNENIAPILYLYRKIEQDSAGAGKYRGGNCAVTALKIHGVDSQQAILSGHGVEVPNAIGLFGGMMGSCSHNTLIKDSDILATMKAGNLPAEIHELDGKTIDLGAKPGRFTFGLADVFEYGFQGGGGWGDPLLREPEKVMQDVIGGVISGKWAKQLYGVVTNIEKMQVDGPRTGELRKRKLQQRLVLTPRVTLLPQLSAIQAKKLIAMGEALEIIDMAGKKIVRCRCGHQMGPMSQNWKEYAARNILRRQHTGALIKLHMDLEIREYLCPRCGLLHSVEIAHKDDKPLWEIQLNLDLPFQSINSGHRQG